MSAAGELHLGTTPEEYHRDPAPEPSLSASLAQLLLDQSPRHAWWNSPKLNPEAHERLEDMDSQKRLRLEHGTALHTMVLGAGSEVRIVEADDYRSKAAKEAREEARELGDVPVLSGHAAKLERIAAAARGQARAHRDLGPALAGGGTAETVALWQEEVPGAGTLPPRPKVWCRALADFIPADAALPVVDWKFTSTSTAPQTYQRAVQGMALRAHHYLRGLERCGQPRAGYLVAAVEMEPPHGLTVFRPNTALLNLGRELWEEALAIWARHLALGSHEEAWPLYPDTAVEVGPDPWKLGRAEDERLMREEAWAMREARVSMPVAASHRLRARLGGPLA